MSRRFGGAGGGLGRGNVGDGFSVLRQLPSIHGAQLPITPEMRRPESGVGLGTRKDGDFKDMDTTSKNRLTPFAYSVCKVEGTIIGSKGAAGSAKVQAKLRDAVPWKHTFEGYLMRREYNRVGKAKWKRRYAVLSGCYFALFEDHTLEKPLWAVSFLSASHRELIVNRELWTTYGDRFVFAVLAGSDISVSPQSHPMVHRHTVDSHAKSATSVERLPTKLTPQKTKDGEFYVAMSPIHTALELEKGSGGSGGQSAAPGSPSPSAAPNEADSLQKTLAEKGWARQRGKRLGPVGLKTTSPGCEVFQANNKLEFQEWTQAIMAQMRVAASMPIATLWGTAPRLLDALSPLEVLTAAAAQVTHEGPTLLPISDFSVQQELGRGSFGSVSRAIHGPTGLEVAVKEIVKPLQGDSKEMEALREELACNERIAVLEQARRKHLVCMWEVIESLDKVYMVMEFAPGKDLHNLITAQFKSHQRGFSESTARAIFCEVVDAVCELHDCGIIHRDMKPENVQMVECDQDAEGAINMGNQKFARVMLLDFGFGKVLPYQLPVIKRNGQEASTIDMARMVAAREEELTKLGAEIASHGAPKSDTKEQKLSHSLEDAAESETVAMQRHLQEMYNMSVPISDDGEVMMDTIFGTRYAASPEIWHQVPYTRSVDSWGLGVILYMLLMGQEPFRQDGDMPAMIKAGVFKRSEPWGALSLNARHLVCNLLSPTAAERLMPEQIRSHPWVAFSRRPRDSRRHTLHLRPSIVSRPSDASDSGVPGAPMFSPIPEVSPTSEARQKRKSLPFQ